jgi:hypothetical protein
MLVFSIISGSGKHTSLHELMILKCTKAFSVFMPALFVFYVLLFGHFIDFHGGNQFKCSENNIKLQLFWGFKCFFGEVHLFQIHFTPFIFNVISPML